MTSAPTASPALASATPPARGLGRRLWDAVLAFLALIGLRRVPDVDPETRIAGFRVHHTEFRNLLTANNGFLETIAEIERKREGGEYFDLFWLERKILRASVDVYRMVESLAAISDDRYPALRGVRDRIATELTDLIEREKALPTERLVLDLDAIDARGAGLVGGKMANLGEIRRGVGLPTPDGFAATTEAYRLFVQANNLPPAIQAETLALEGPGGIGEAARRLQELIFRTPVPESLAAALLAAYDRLAERSGVAPRVAVRSSALGEDGKLSFAGQFLSLLNVPRKGLVESYREVLASLFSPEAMHYRHLHGVPPESASMAVGFVPMIDAQVAGVVFTRDPGRRESGDLLVHAVRGLGVTLVDGHTSPEVLRVARGADPCVVERTASGQGVVVRSREEPGIESAALAASETGRPVLSDGEAIALARWALALESHFGAPQDIEWAMGADRRPVLLQSRPLRLVDAGAAAEPPIAGATVLLEGGDVACPGVGVGPAVLLDENGDLDAFPAGGVLIAPRSSPRFVRIMDRVAAIVADAGSTTGHMASLAREFHVPALLNARTATATIAAGAVVTVDARHARVYAGEVPGLAAGPRESAPRGARADWVRETPAYRLLDRAAELVLPLHLTDPRSPSFAAEKCRTLHDLARFVHEKSYAEMFRMGGDLGDLRGASYLLDVFLPIDLYILDLGGGLVPGVTGRKVKPAQVASVPLRALLAGMLDKRIPRFGPRPMDARGMLSIMMRHAMSSPENERTFQDPSYAIVSDVYTNYTARVGYHFGVVDTYCGKTANKNYVTMHFRGGAADLVRRSRRTRAIAGILRASGFAVEVKDDSVIGRLSKAPPEEMTDRLEMLGRLLQFVRQMDVAMVSDAAAQTYQDAFLRGDYALTGKGAGDSVP